MSGRDLRGFLSNHRVDDLEKLTVRLRDGLGSSRYKPVEYEQLQAMLEAKRVASQHIEEKVRRTKQAAKDSKESSLLRQHRTVWTKENQRLARAGEKAESELWSFMEQRRGGGRGGGDPEKGDSSGAGNRGVMAELLDEDLALEAERELFQRATVVPVWQLREDLQYRLGSMHHASPEPSEWEQILQQVHFVMEQQEAVEDKLHAESLALEQELAELAVQELYSSEAPELVSDLQEVPQELLSCDCPYPDLPASLIQAFHALTQRYQERLQQLEQRLEGLDRHCGWSPDEHLRFQLTVGQYPAELRARRHLYMDMLTRLYPHTARQQLIDHECTWDWYRFSLAQRKALLEGWRRDRAELLTTAQATLEEARQHHQQQAALQEDRQSQQQICSQLRDKLQQWHARQEEVSRLEEAIAERSREEEQERLKREQERHAAKRTRQKEQVRQFYAELSRRREVVQRRDEARLQELRRAMEEQARSDRERVQFREELLAQRREEKEMCAIYRLCQEEERQERLQALRNQVAVVAEADPERMMGDTEAWRGKQQAKEDEAGVQRPLYQLNTYTDTQIVSDPRLRIEQALRQAGLHQTLYAKEVLSAVQPPRPPRRDMESTAFKS